MLSANQMITDQVVLRLGSADSPATQVGLLGLRPTRLGSFIRFDGSRLSFDLPDEERVRIHLTSSNKPFSLLPDWEVQLHRPGIIGVRVEAEGPAEFVVHFLGDGRLISTRQVRHGVMVWFDPPEKASAIAFSILVEGEGEVVLDGVEVITPPISANVQIGPSLVESLKESVFPIGPTSWPTSFSVDLVKADVVTVNGRRLQLRRTEWSSIDSEDRTWQLLVHGFSFIPGVLERRPDSATLLAELLLDWARFHPIRPHSTTVMSWNDMAVAKRTMALLAVLDRLRFLESSVLLALTSMLAVHAQWLAHPRNYLADHDHGLYSDTALEFAARALRAHPVAARWERIARTRFHSTAAHVIDASEGTVREHSPAYVDAVARLIAERRNNGLTDSLAPDLEDRLADTLAALTTPDGFLLPWGDTALAHRSPLSRMGVSVGFPQTGWSVSHHDRSTVGLTSSFHSGNHKHRDELSLVYYDAEGPVIFEAGFPGYAYGSEEREYAESDRAHSGVIVDTISGSENPMPFGGAVSSPVSSGDWHAIVGWNPSARRYRHYRVVLHHPDTVVIIDIVSGHLVRGVTRVFHVGPRHSVHLDGTGRILMGERTLSLDWPRLPEISVAPDDQSRHFGEEYRGLRHTALLIRDRGPGTYAAVVSHQSAPVGLRGIDVLGASSGIELDIHLNTGTRLALTAIPAERPRDVKLAVS